MPVGPPAEYITRFLDPDRPEDQTAWADLLARSPHSTPFTRPAYAAALGEALDLTHRFTVVFKEAEPLAGALLFERRRGPFRAVVVPAFTQYSPLLLAHPPAEAAVHRRDSPLDCLLAFLEGQYDLLAFELVPTITDVRAFQWRNWTVHPRYSYVLALDAPDKIQQAWSEGTRRKYRKTHTQFEVDERPGAAARVVSHCKASYHRQGRAFPADEQRLAAAVRLLVERGMARVFVASPKGVAEPEGGMVVLHDGDAAYYWIAGSRPGNAMTVLLGRVLPRLAETGIRRFDFVGANTPSIAEFKRRFGPTLCRYFRVERCTHPVLGPLRTLRNAFRRRPGLPFPDTS